MLSHCEGDSFEFKPCTIHQRQYLDWKAKLAYDLMARIALCAARIEGEDSAGRAKLQVLTPEEVVERANAIADLAMDSWEKRGWILTVPMPEKRPPKATRHYEASTDEKK